MLKRSTLYGLVAGRVDGVGRLCAAPPRRLKRPEAMMEQDARCDDGEDTGRHDGGNARRDDGRDT